MFFLTPDEFNDDHTRGTIAVVIDVLRASTSLATALFHGCSQIIPVAEVATAKALAAQQSKSTTLLCGERKGEKVQGFHLGNSPAEYAPENVRNKTLIFTSTNGSRLLVRAKSAAQTVLGAFVNADIVADHLLKYGSAITILCAGKENTFSLEDTVCAGLFIHKLHQALQNELALNDAAMASMVLYQKHEHNLLEMLKASNHGQYLAGIGFGRDLPLCAKLNSMPVLPIFRGGILSRADFEEFEDDKILR